MERELDTVKNIAQQTPSKVRQKDIGDEDPNFRPNKRTLKQTWDKYKTFYLMVFPAIISYVIFSYWPMTGIVLAFREFSFTSGMYGTGFVGLKYFRDFFTHRETLMYVKNTVAVSAMKLFVYLPFPIILALMFNEVKQPKLRSTYQSISYLPYFVSWVVVIGIMGRLFAPDTGLINVALESLGLTDGKTFWMMQEGFFYPSIFFSYLWKNIGWDSIIYFAAIMGISASLYEAAAVDGAGRLRQVWHITLPGIRTTIVVLFILSLGSILSAGFDQVYLLQNPGNYQVSETIDTYIVKTGLERAQYGPATAVGLVQGVAGLILTLIVNKVADKFDSSVW